MHRLTNIDPEARAATCSICGPTRLRRGGPGSWRCVTTKLAHDNDHAARNERKRAQRAKYRSEPKTCPLCLRIDRMVYDHCHRTGEFRGHICSRCNAALGLFGDDPEALRRAAEYLDAG